MTAEFDHVIVTRFNLPSAGPESVIRRKEGWLRDRMELFERYCMPSVMAQRNQQFEWIIYFDPESPEWLRQRIGEQAEKKIYVPVFRASVDSADLVDDIRRVTGQRGSRLITSSLDNDDALAIDFIERIQAAAPHSGRTAIYLVRGLIKRDRQLYLRPDRHNAFPSVVEDWTAPSTCWSDWHTLLGKHMAVLELHDGPGWLQVIHNSNVSNRVRGRLTSPAGYRTLFPGLLDDVRVPRVVEAAADVVAGRSWRAARDYFRSMVKGVIMLLAGKDGLDRVKDRLAASQSVGRARMRS
jgi:hypothetical protein